METQEMERTEADEAQFEEITNEITPSGGWLLRITPTHHCIKPDIDNQTFVGSVWNCGECGQHWLVYQRRGKNAGQKALKRISAEKARTLVDKKKNK